MSGFHPLDSPLREIVEKIFSSSQQRHRENLEIQSMRTRKDIQTFIKGNGFEITLRY